MSTEASSETAVVIKQEHDTASKVRAQKRVKELSEAGAKTKRASGGDKTATVSNVKEMETVLKQQVESQQQRQGKIAQKILPLVTEQQGEAGESKKQGWWIQPAANSDINTLVPDIGKTKLRVRGDLLLAGGAGLGYDGNEQEDEMFRAKRCKTELAYGYIGKYRVSKQTLVVFEHDDEKVAFQPEKIQLLLKTLTEQRSQADREYAQSVAGSQ
jgi:hypothetical protein